MNDETCAGIPSATGAQAAGSRAHARGPLSWLTVVRREPWRAVLLLLLLLPAHDFLRVCVARVDFPYEVEWVEGELALHALRFEQHHGLVQMYPEYENGRYVPWLYAPVYQILLGCLYGLFDSVHLGFGRFLSIIASFGIMGGIAAIVRTHTRSWFCAAAGALSYLWFFKASGYWYDLVRVDSLAYCFAIWSAYFINLPRGSWRNVSSGLALGFLAHFTKQTTMFLPAALLCFSLFIVSARAALCRWGSGSRRLRQCLRFIPKRRTSLPALGIFFLFLGGVILMLRTDRFAPMVLYIYSGPSRHTFIWKRILTRSTPELWQYYSFTAWLLPLSLWIAVAARRWSNRAERWIVFMLGLAGSVAFYTALGIVSAGSDRALADLNQGGAGFLSLPAMRLVASAWSEPVRLAVALTLGGLFMWIIRWGLHKTSLSGLQWVLLLFAAQHIAIVTRVKIGAWVNSYMALFTVQSVVAGICIAWLMRAGRKRAWRNGIGAVLIVCAGLTWFGTRDAILAASAAPAESGNESIAQGTFKPVLSFEEKELGKWSPWMIDGLRYHRPRTWYRPWSTRYGDQIPAEKSRRAWDELVESIASLERDGGVYLPHQNYVGLLAGVEPGPSIDAIRDVTLAGRQTPVRLIERILKKEDRYLVLMFPLREEWFTRDLTLAVYENYREVGPLFTDESTKQALEPRTGAIVYPLWLYERY